MNDKTESAFQITYKKANQELVVSIIKRTIPEMFKTYTPAHLIKPIIELKINPAEFQELISSFKMKKSSETETYIQYSTFNQFE